MTVIVDYGAGNLESVKNALFCLKEKAIVASSSKILEKASRIIFPGVGHFARAVYELKAKKLFEPLKAQIKSGVPFLGICLGMHLLFEKSSEAESVSGLGVLEGDVLKFRPGLALVPHMGWNQIKKVQASKPQALSQNKGLFTGIADGSYFYFAHSYFCRPRFADITLALTEHGVKFVSAVHRENIWAVQFHPEKSQDNGLKVLSNFLRL